MKEDIAEHAVEAMREDGMMPRWKVEKKTPSPRPAWSIASLRLGEVLTLHIHYDPNFDWTFANVSLARGVLPDGDLDRMMSELPGLLAPAFEAAAAELRRIDSMTPRLVSEEKGGP
jgi:hypothetical protein